MKTSSYWNKRALNRLTDSEKQSEKYINNIKGIYNQAYRNIDNEIHSIYKNYSKATGLDTQKLKELLTRSETQKEWEQMKRQGLDQYVLDNYKSRISRMEQIQAQIYAKAKMIYPKEELQNTMCYKGIINNSYYKAIYDIQMGTSLDFPFATIDDNLINVLLNEKWSGKNYSERIWGNTDLLANKVSTIVGGALISGQGIAKTSKQIRDRFNVAKHYADRLVRTEANHFHNTADALACEKLGAKKYVFMAVLDNRTSDICQQHDHKRFTYAEREEGKNFPPLHPNCRSTTRAYISEEVENDLKRRARNPETGKTEIISNMSYNNWAKQHNIDKPNVNNSLNNIANDNKIKHIVGTNTHNILKSLGIKYNNVLKLTNNLQNDTIINKVGGADKTTGSCASLSLAYAGNKLGYDVLDFRGGESQSFFSNRLNLINMFDDLGIKYSIEPHTNDFIGAKRLLNKVEQGKEYILNTGCHSSVVRNNNGTLEYLELQSDNVNGFKPLDATTLRYRFGCKKSHSLGGRRYKVNNLLVDIDDIKDNKKGFREVLGYLNTKSKDQLKGVGGYAK